MIIYTQNRREYKCRLWFWEVSFPVTAGIFLVRDGGSGKDLLRSRFYHWIGGGILHDGFEAVVKTQFQVST